MDTDSAPSLIARAHAKINLDLRVHRHRADGYHELSTVFQSLALNDEIIVCASQGKFTLACDVPDIPADATNLVWRAAVRLAAALDRSLDGLAITLRKRVPAEAGLGGGSADAAATLRLLAARWNLEPDAPVLTRVAGELGADVPFFLVGGTALGTGRGDCIQPLVDLPQHQVLVVLPPFRVSTREAYVWFDGAQPHGRVRRVVQARDEAPDWRDVASSTATTLAWQTLLPQVRSDLEPVVTARHPEIGTAVGALRAAGAGVAIMSGSGSAVVGLFRTKADVEHAVRAVETIIDRDGWRLLQTRTIDRETYRRSLSPRPVSLERGPLAGLP
ncbi:MAG: 4-(cytidine 5'-diphospho)-2-C-methyl-D-erythritol kinase [Luteitalea sp.]|nr:4-(cytidine 5'-diphospho)-2-C-methyl-D-erythritol kinase [Luteitalea sp.]